jgi:hypothetical protein
MRWITTRSDTPKPLHPIHVTLIESIQLFQISQVIFPQHDVPIPSRGFSLPKGDTSIPFKLRFPVLSSCQNPQDWIKHVETTLPPSFKFVSPKSDGSATIEYYIRAEVTRASRFRSDLTDRLSLDFLPLDPTLPPPMLEPTQNKSTRLLRFETPKSPGSASPGGNVVVDARQVTLAATLPAPAVLRNGGSVPLGVFVTVKEGEESSSPLFLRSLTLTLLTEVTIHIGPNLKTWTTTQDILSTTSLDVEIPAGDQQEISKELWKNVKLPENLPPSFTSCSLMQEHFLVVAIGLSSGQQSTILVSLKNNRNLSLADVFRT